MNFKKIIIVAVVTSLVVTLSVSYVHAQTVSFSSSNSTITFGSSNSTQINPTSTICANSISSSMYTQGLQINSTKAISLSSGNYQYRSKIQGYNSTFATVFETWSLDGVNCKATLSTVNVGYVLSNHTGYVKNLVMTLDPTLSNVTDVISYMGGHYFVNSNSTFWSGYEFSSNGDTTGVNLNYSNLSYQIPAISQPPSSSNSQSCISPSIGCDLAVWTGLENGDGQSLVQAGTDGNMTCTSIGHCSTSNYFLFFELLPNPAFLCFNNNINSADSISVTVTYNGNGKYTPSVQDSTANFGCSTIQYNYGMTNPKYAAFINERATWGTHRDEIAKFNPVTMNGIIAYSNTSFQIATSKMVSNDTMINPITSSGTKNISVGGIGSGAFSESWLSSDNTNTCIPPNSGDWTVSTSCSLDKTSTPPANVIIQNNSVFTIPSGLSLAIDFIHQHLLVNSGSGVLIKAGGKIT